MAQPYTKRRRVRHYTNIEDQLSLAKWAKKHEAERTPEDRIVACTADLRHVHDRLVDGLDPADAIALNNLVADAGIELFQLAGDLKIDLLSAIDYRMCERRQGDQTGIEDRR